MSTYINNPQLQNDTAPLRMRQRPRTRIFGTCPFIFHLSLSVIRGFRHQLHFALRLFAKLGKNRVFSPLPLLLFLLQKCTSRSLVFSSAVSDVKRRAKSRISARKNTQRGQAPVALARGGGEEIISEDNEHTKTCRSRKLPWPTS